MMENLNNNFKNDISENDLRNNLYNSIMMENLNNNLKNDISENDLRNNLYDNIMMNNLKNDNCVSKNKNISSNIYG